jgi:hypothetical protein
MEEACRFSLIFPPWPWLPWVTAIAGIALCWFIIRAIVKSPNTGSIWEMSLKDFTLKASGIGIPLLLGIALTIAGLAIGAADYYQPFARVIGDKFPSLISEADPILKAEYHDEPMRSIVEQANASGQYSIRMAQGVGEVAITGDYKEALCGADLIEQICRREPGKIWCNIDNDQKVIRVCTKADPAPCTNRTL